MANMHIVQQHFGLRVFMGTSWSDCEILLHPNTKVIKPAYRDVISGRSTGALNGLDSVEMSASHYRLVGLGSTAGDVLPELVRRRCIANGHDFKVTLHYRTPRRYTTYMGTLVQPPGVFPLYYSTQYSTLGQRIDAKILQVSKNKYPQIERMGLAFRSHEAKMQASGKDQGFAAIMNVLVYHPVVALKVAFEGLKDKSELNGDDPTCVLMDCTNHVNYHVQKEDETPSYRVNFAPNMLGILPAFSKVICGSHRLPGPLFGQWSTGQGAMGVVLRPHVLMDVSKPLFPCISQCYSVFYFGRFHSIASFWLGIFQFQPTSVQLLGVLIYDILMRLLALTGLTYLFFDAHLYAHTPHQSPAQNFGVIEARWAWFSKQVDYNGDDAVFPCPFSEIPGVPECFSFAWMLQNASTAKVRMTLTLACILVATLYGYGPARETAADVITFLVSKMN